MQGYVTPYLRKDAPFAEKSFGAPLGFNVYTRKGYADAIRSYLKWQFGKRAPNWRRVQPKHVWDYAYSFQRGRRPGTLNHDLRRLRRFFMFVHVLTACSPQLIQAVPPFLNLVTRRSPTV